MSEVSYSNVPPMMAAIKSGDIEAIRSLLHAGHSPNEPQCYQVMIGEWPRDGEASPLELAVLENRMDMVQLLIESGPQRKGIYAGCFSTWWIGMSLMYSPF